MPYFDNAATTPLLKPVIADMTEIMSQTFGNPSSIHGEGRKASKILREQRDIVANLLQTKPNRIYFTSGGTESNNTAIKGYAIRHQNKGKHIITTAVEHHSVLHVLHFLENEYDFEITYLTPVNHSITAKQVKDALREDTILVSIMAANNETGAVMPIKEIGEILEHHSAAFHVDAVQTAGKLPLVPELDKIDFLSLSAHKFHGPKGVGLLYSKIPNFQNLLHGGDQENKKRAGTENLTGIVGMTSALKLSYEHLTEHFKKVSALRETFLKQLENINYYLNSSENNLPYVLNIGFNGYDNGKLLTQLDLEGFCISTGSACTAGTVEPSHVLEANYGKNAKQLRESIRISFSHLNTIEEVIALANKIKEIIGK